MYSFWKSERTCQYPTGQDAEMKNVRFSDGSSVKSIMFGCWTWQRCCGTECCFETVLFSVIGLIFLIAGIYAALYAAIKYVQEAPLTEVGIPLNERRNLEADDD
ncbi:hypothetical protein GCK72_017902 [Caenorhabditis remanei]|uniref:CX domain-containing protein n=1 Tax=Caenorhabditis remanei TaxID=31234 RepID=A0A6A5G8C8_CAERE|nr:hypothetical protein GCK72_017902 [Caenorhabditis remanei]KAF1751348.1 hypothetical protein GCK72_017902 [Caenorhabditis remanei]